MYWYLCIVLFSVNLDMLMTYFISNRPKRLSLVETCKGLGSNMSVLSSQLSCFQAKCMMDNINSASGSTNNLDRAQELEGLLGHKRSLCCLGKCILSSCSTSYRHSSMRQCFAFKRTLQEHRIIVILC